MKVADYYFLALLICALFSGCTTRSSETIIIGSKMDTEGSILGYIQILVLQDAGFKVEDRIETGPTLIVRQALLSGEIDGYVEYTGTALVNFMKLSDRKILTDPNLSYVTIAEWDSLNHGINWLKPWPGINNTYTVLMQGARAKAQETKTISDLSKWVESGGKILFGSDHEFSARPDGLNGLLKTYGLSENRNFEVINMDAGLVYQTLHQGSIDAAIGYSTDGRISAFNFARLDDDLNYFPVYNPTPLFRKKTLERFPEVREIINRISTLISADEITEMNYRHDVNLERAKVLAREWLIKKNLIKK